MHKSLRLIKLDNIEICIIACLDSVAPNRLSALMAADKIIRTTDNLDQYTIEQGIRRAVRRKIISKAEALDIFGVRHG